MTTTLTVDVGEAATIEEVDGSPSSGAVMDAEAGGMNDLDLFDLTSHTTTGTTGAFSHTIDDPDGANYVVLAINLDGFSLDDQTDATITFDGVEMTLGGTKTQRYFSFGGSSGVYYLMKAAGWAAGTYTVGYDLGAWPVGTSLGIVSGRSTPGDPQVLDTFIYGDNNASGATLWSVTPNGTPCVAIGFQLNTGSTGVLDGAAATNEQFWPGETKSPLYFGVAQETWTEEYPRSDDRDINTGFSGVGKRRCLVLIGDGAGAGGSSTSSVAITDAGVESAYSDGITVILE